MLFSVVRIYLDNLISEGCRIMLTGSKCKFRKKGAHLDGNEVFFGVIASEPCMMQETGDFWVLVLADGVLNRADTDYIFDIEQPSVESQG